MLFQPAFQTSLKNVIGLWIDGQDNVYFTELFAGRLSVLSFESGYTTVQLIATGYGDMRAVTGDSLLGTLFVNLPEEIKVFIPAMPTALPTVVPSSVPTVVSELPEEDPVVSSTCTAGSCKKNGRIHTTTWNSKGEWSQTELKVVYDP